MLLFLHCLAQPGDILVVFLKAVRKAVVAIPVADEVVVISVRRTHSSSKGGATRIPDRSGWKAWMGIGVVQRLEAYVVMMEHPAIVSVEQFSIDHAATSLQRH